MKTKLCVFILLFYTIVISCFTMYAQQPNWGTWKSLYEMEYKTPTIERIDILYQQPPFWTWINAAWETMMIKQGITPKEDISKITGTILEMWEQSLSGYNNNKGLTNYLEKKYGAKVAGNTNIGRTNPPLRQTFPIRYELMKLICVLHDFQEILLEVAEQNKETIMPGYTHIRQAQPMTFGHYLLSVYDPLARSMEIVEKSYDLMSLNELGCGALAGMSWPIDRKMVDDYLGMKMLENTNDAVAYTDGYVTLVAGLTNIAAIMSRVALELDFWSGPEYDFIYFDGVGGGSFMMPNKKDNQPYLERTRVYAAKMLGKLTEVAAMGMRTPQGDMHEMLHMEAALEAIQLSFLFMHIWPNYLKTLRVNKERMLESVKNRYSCSTELANIIVRDFGINYRTAHEIVHDFVKESINKDIPSSKADVSILNKAAKSVTGEKLNITDKKLQQALDPVNFINVTTSQGGVSPIEVERMINERKKILDISIGRHLQRINKLEKAKEKLFNDVKTLYNSSYKE